MVEGRQFASIAALMAACLVAHPAAAANPDPFAKLADAYKRRDATIAADAYSGQAEVVYRYFGAPTERYKGRPAIRSSFAALFGSVAPESSLDLNFRVTNKAPRFAQGFYRLRIGTEVTNYGRFAVRFDNDGRFVSDESTDSTIAEFETATGPLLIKPDDEELDRTYYRRLAGRYRLPNGCQLVVTRSSVRLFVRNMCSQEWRGLNRVSGLEWTAGDTVISDQVKARYRFVSPGTGLSPSLTLSAGAQSAVAKRVDSYSSEDVTFAGKGGIRLSGTIYRPNRRVARSGVVLVHGSGPQDRDGYASIIAVMADALASSGRAVLVYDKRGSGQSGGDGNRANFDLLGEDAAAGMRFLASHLRLDPTKIGLAGSSQAGWIVAKAIANGARPRDVFLLGAAGTAMTVAQQNIYNTRVRMLCAGIPAAEVDLAIAQQQAFFDALADRAKAGALDAITARAKPNARIAEWLFPDSSGLTANDGSWFTVLDPSFNPFPVWKKYPGKATFVFSQHDDATDTQFVTSILGRSVGEVRILPGAQHLGLRTTDRCRADIGLLQRFSAELFDQLDRFAKAGARHGA